MASKKIVFESSKFKGSASDLLASLLGNARLLPKASCIRMADVSRPDLELKMYKGSLPLPPCGVFILNVDAGFHIGTGQQTGFYQQNAYLGLAARDWRNAPRLFRSYPTHSTDMNAAEHTVIAEALSLISTSKFRDFIIYSDSATAVRDFQNQYKSIEVVKQGQEVKYLGKHKKVVLLLSVLREKNSLGDYMAKFAKATSFDSRVHGTMPGGALRVIKNETLDTYYVKSISKGVKGDKTKVHSPFFTYKFLSTPLTELIDAALSDLFKDCFLQKFMQSISQTGVAEDGFVFYLEAAGKVLVSMSIDIRQVETKGFQQRDANAEARSFQSLCKIMELVDLPREVDLRIQSQGSSKDVEFPRASFSLGRIRGDNYSFLPKVTIHLPILHLKEEVEEEDNDDLISKVFTKRVKNFREEEFMDNGDPFGRVLTREIKDLYQEDILVDRVVYLRREDV